MINHRIDKLIAYLSNRNIYTYRLGIARTMLAFATLSSLVFNDTNILFVNGDKLNSGFYSSQLFFFQKVNLFEIFGSTHAALAKSIGILVLLIVISGWKPRYTCIFHAWVCLSFNYTTLLIEGGDQIASNLSLMLIPILILDKRSWHWQNQTGSQVNNLVANYVLILIKFQICILYLDASVGKLASTEWANGTAVYYWFNDPIFGMGEWLRPLLNPILYNPFGVAILTWGTLILEFLLFLAIFFNNKNKLYLMITAIVFHFSIVLIHGLASFFLSMVAGLLLYLWVDNPYGEIKCLEKDRISKPRQFLPDMISN